MTNAQALRLLEIECVGCLKKNKSKDFCSTECYRGLAKEALKDKIYCDMLCGTVEK